MRELEFIPAWYPTLRRKRRFLLMQIWLSIGVVAVLALWMALAEHRITRAQYSLETLKIQLDASNDELEKLNELQSLKGQLSQQAQVVSRLGPHVPTARILNALEQAMPREIGVLDVTMDTQQQAAQQSTLQAAAGAPPRVDQRMCVKVHGVSPTGAELGDFLARLAAVGPFTDIAVPRCMDRVQDGHTMQEFEVSFSIDLNSIGG